GELGSTPTECERSGRYGFEYVDDARKPFERSGHDDAHRRSSNELVKSRALERREQAVPELRRGPRNAGLVDGAADPAVAAHGHVHVDPAQPGGERGETRESIVRLG